MVNILIRIVNMHISPFKPSHLILWPTRKLALHLIPVNIFWLNPYSLCLQIQMLLDCLFSPLVYRSFQCCHQCIVIKTVAMLPVAIRNLTHVSLLSPPLPSSLGSTCTHLPPHWADRQPRWSQGTCSEKGREGSTKKYQKVPKSNKK